MYMYIYIYQIPVDLSKVQTDYYDREVIHSENLLIL